jgi:hypothetical protein
VYYQCVDWHATLTDTEGVTGSIPVAPTNFSRFPAPPGVPIATVRHARE